MAGIVGTYCYRHGVVVGGCTECGSWEFPDIPLMAKQERAEKRRQSRQKD